MICPNCRQLLADGTAKCSRCGEEISPQQFNSINPPPEQQSVYRQVPAPQPYSQFEGQFQPQQQQVGGWQRYSNGQQQQAGQYYQNGYSAPGQVPPQNFPTWSNQQGYGGAQQQPSYPNRPYRGKDSSNGIVGCAAASIICAFLFPVAGIVLGVISIVFFLSSRKQQFENQSPASLVMGIIGTVLSIIVLVLSVLFIQGLFRSAQDFTEHNEDSHAYNHSYNINLGDDSGNSGSRSANSSHNSGDPDSPDDAATSGKADPTKGFAGTWYLESGMADGQEIDEKTMSELSAMGIQYTLELVREPNTAKLELFNESFMGTWSQTGMKRGFMELSGGEKVDLALEDNKLVMTSEGNKLIFSPEPVEPDKYMKEFFDSTQNLGNIGEDEFEFSLYNS